MENRILKVGHKFDSFEAAQREWLKYHVFTKTAESMPEALKLLAKTDFLLIVICCPQHRIPASFEAHARNKTHADLGFINKIHCF